VTLLTPQRLLTPQQYLAFEDQASERHEYVDGVVYALPGESLEHNEVAGALYTLLRAQARGRGCRVAFEGVKLWIASSNRYYYPDVMVLCDPRDTDPKIFQYPCFIAEVLSPSTEATDRREKLQAYRTIETLQGYLMIDPRARVVDYLERTPRGWHASRLAGEVEIACLTMQLGVEALFEGLEGVNTRES
jgi:Uma2 family endonuclease